MRAGGWWVDRNAGPVVRPYALTGGRTQPVTGAILDLIAVVVAAGRADGDDLSLSPEHHQILGLCRGPTTVADVASAISLPVGVVRVLLADLIPQGQIKVMAQRQAAAQPSAGQLKEVLHALRSL
jgi:Protein of unknown function (DUF742)